MTHKQFEGKVAFITGGGSGIGRGTALAFAELGALVAVVGRGKTAIEETVAMIKQQGGRALAILADVSKSDEVQLAVDTTILKLGGLDIAHNNAGYFPPPMPLAELDSKIWSQTVGVNLNGVLFCMQRQIAHMRTNGGGVIINTASNIGIHSRRPNMAAYAAVKAAVSTLTAGAALDYIADDIRINAVSPGAIATNMSLRAGESEVDRAMRLKSVVPIGRVGEVEEIAQTVLWLASPAASFIVGQDIVVDGGVTA